LWAVVEPVESRQTVVVLVAVVQAQWWNMTHLA
jgi:hypothetical protein